MVKLRLARVSFLTPLAFSLCATDAAAGDVPASLAASQPAYTSPVELHTGKSITPTASTGAIFQNLFRPNGDDAPPSPTDRAVALALSPDGRTLAILTNGWISKRSEHQLPEETTASNYLYPDRVFVFLFDVTGSSPRQRQVLSIPNGSIGLTWSPDSRALYISGGTSDEIYEWTSSGGDWVKGPTVHLGHSKGLGIESNLAGFLLDNKPVAGALAASPDGSQLLVANFQNDSVSLVNLSTGQVSAEQDLRPGRINPRQRGEPGGSYPRSVLWISSQRAYVTSERDREIIALHIAPTKVRVVARIAVHGQPIALTRNKMGTRLYVALDNTDQVAVLDTGRNRLIEEFSVIAPPSVYSNAARLGGASPNALALTPDEQRLLVSNGGENEVAVVNLGDAARDAPKHEDSDDHDSIKATSTVIGLVPTGYYPTGVVTSVDGSLWYIINAKSETGANAGWCHQVDSVTGLCHIDNPAPIANGGRLLSKLDEYNYQHERAGFLTMPAPSALELARLTRQVAHNNHFDNPELSRRDQDLFAFLREHIHHVIYIIKENRTYDQILGDLPVGNGDPRLTLFPQRITPNHHALAQSFVTLDNFLLSGEGSWTGWDYSTAARINDFRMHQEVANGHGAMSSDEWGQNRNINVCLPTSAERHAERPVSPEDPDLLPGARDVGELDGPGGVEGRGYIWDAALRKGLAIRNYGFYGLLDWSPPLLHDPAAQALRVFYPTKPSLRPFTDPFYRGFDPRFPDFWRYREWKREFDEFAAKGSAPALMLMQLGNDHTGAFVQAIDGINTPETQVADNDYALGMIIEAVSNSPFAQDTLIFAVEDDTCDGPDHADAMRSIAIVAGPYVRQHALVSTRYTTVSMVKTIEEILGIGPVGLNDSLAAPMSEIFDTRAMKWSYSATVPNILRSTQLPIPQGAGSLTETPIHSAAYWSKAMAGQDFSAPDRLNNALYNRALWRGIKGSESLPVRGIALIRVPSGND